MSSPRTTKKGSLSLMLLLPLLFACITISLGVLGLLRSGAGRETARPAVYTAPQPSGISMTASSSNITPNVPQHTPSSTVQGVKTASAVPVSSGQYGMAVAATLYDLSDARLKAELSTISSLGMKWIRIDLDWRAVQQGPSAPYDWSRYDRIVTAARAANLKVLPILLGTPSWAASQDCTQDKCPPGDVHVFALFAHAAAVHFSKEGVHAWEIWNEPNMAGSWGGNADPAAYTDLLRSAYPAIKAADKSAVVITGGLGPIDTGDGNISALEFLSKLYDNGAQPYFDAVGFHPYSFPATPMYENSWNAWSQMAETNPSVRSIMVANGDANKKIWITEYGAPTDGPGAEATLDNFTSVQGSDHVDEYLQAMIAYEAATLVKHYSWAGPLFWYSYKDLGTASGDTENFYGLLRYDGSRKPAYTALKDGIAQ